MKTRILIVLLTLCCLLTPLSVFASDAGVLAETSAAVSSFKDGLPAAGTVLTEPKVVVEYDRDAQETPDDLPVIGCKAAFVADPVSGKVFYEKHARKKMYPASTTKLLTALLVLENCDLDDVAVVSRRAVGLVPDGYVRANLQPGERLSVRVLLQALLIPSANDAAFVLAEHVGGSVAGFAKLCNRRAKELGCEKLHFVNPNGIHDDDHYCTAYDLYLIAAECQKHDAFNEIVQMKRVTLPATDVYRSADRTFQNTNQLMNAEATSYYVAGCTGMKTGYTPEAGQCMVASCDERGLSLISVVLGGTVKQNGLNERFTDSKALLDYVNLNYELQTFAKANAVLRQMEVKKATKDTALLDVIVPAEIRCVAPNALTAENVPVEIDLPAELKAPIKQNQVLGTVTYSVDGFCLAANLIASHEVVKKPYWLYNLLVILAVVLLLLIARFVLKKREEERLRQELLRRRRQQQLRQRRQAQGQPSNGQDYRFNR